MAATPTNRRRQSGTFANAQFFLEARPYKENGDFFSINPGGSWQINDLMKLDSRPMPPAAISSAIPRPIWSVTCPSAGNPAGAPGCAAPAGGVFATFSNPGASYPDHHPQHRHQQSGQFPVEQRPHESAGRKALHPDQRRACRFHLGRRSHRAQGRRCLSTMRSAPSRASRLADHAECGLRRQSHSLLPPPNTQPVCRGLNVTGNIATVNAAHAAGSGAIPNLPGYGTGYSTGFPPLTYGGSLVPQSALASLPQAGSRRLHHRQLLGGSFNAIDRAAINALPNAHAGVTGTYPFAIDQRRQFRHHPGKVYGWYAESPATSRSTATICATMSVSAWSKPTSTSPRR